MDGKTFENSAFWPGPEFQRLQYDQTMMELQP